MFQRIKKIFFLFLLASLGIVFFSDFPVKRNLRNIFLKSKVFFIKKTYGSCQIKKIVKIPKDSIVIIGHAYGSPSKKSDFISKNIQFFLKNNIQNINTIVFTGDVFKFLQKKNGINSIICMEKNQKFLLLQEIMILDLITKISKVFLIILSQIISSLIKLNLETLQY